MKQINFHVDRKFQQTLSILMKRRGIKTKSEALRIAVEEAVQRILQSEKKRDIKSSLGLGLLVGKLDKKRKYLTEDDLW